jgi:hypothetical protein
MTRSVLVLGVAHELQGSKFQGYVDDPSHGLLLKSSMHGVDFVFEEASGLGPSKAEDLAISILGAGQYVDIDPSLSERSSYGIPEVTAEGHAVAPMHSTESYCSLLMEAQRIREEVWIQRIKRQTFKKALAIVGIGHSLSIAFRLESAGFVIAEIRAYTPYGVLCRRAHSA